MFTYWKQSVACIEACFLFKDVALTSLTPAFFASDFLANAFAQGRSFSLA